MDNDILEKWIYNRTSVTLDWLNSYNLERYLKEEQKFLIKRGNKRRDAFSHYSETDLTFNTTNFSSRISCRSG